MRPPGGSHRGAPEHGRTGKLVVQQWVTFDNSAAEQVRRLVAAGRDPWDFAATVTGDPAATIRELKEQSGKDIWLWGSLALVRSLRDVGLVDEVRMLVCPVSRGKGRRIFEDTQDLRMVEATPFENGVVLLRYDVKR